MYNLTRNYKEDPLKQGEIPCYEDLHYLYIQCNLTHKDMAPIFGVKPCTTRKYTKHYNLKKDKDLWLKSRENTNLKLYGVAHCSQSQEFQDKVKQTCLEKYGVTNANKCQQIKDKIKQTNLERYGVEVASKCDIVKQKTKQTCLQKYGVESFTQTDNFKQQAQITNLEKYGNTSAVRNEDVKNKIKQTNIEKYGVPYALMKDEIIQKGKQTCLEKWGTSNISTKHIDPQILELINDKQKLFNYVNKFEIKDIRQIAKTLGISYDGLKKKLQQFDLWDKFEHNTSYPELELQELFPEFDKTRQILKPQEIDLYCDKYKLGIEFNGIYWHSELFKNKTYHQDKSNLAKDKGIFLYHIYEHEWQNERQKQIIISQINNLIGNNIQKIGARQCEIKLLEDKQCQEFLLANHIQGQDNSSIRIGLFHKQELVSVMTFCKPRFNKNYQWELSRLCNKLNTTVMGGASKLFKFFIKTYNPQNIISYSNCSKTKGLIYPILGFEFEQQTQPNYIWFKQKEVLSRYACQKHKLKEFEELGTTESEIMHNRGFLKLYDCGNYTWTWKNQA